MAILNPAPSTINPQTAPTAVPFRGGYTSQQAQIFQTLLMDLLGKSQKLDTQGLDFYSNLQQREQLNRMQSPTPESLRQLSPTQQEQIRGSNVSALEGERALVSAAQKSRETKIQQLPQIISSLSTLMKSYGDEQDFEATTFSTDSEGRVTFLGKRKDGSSVKEDFGLVGKPLKDETDALTEYQKTQTFNNIVNKYNSSPLVLASDRTPVLKGAIDAIRKNPSNGALQLNLVYSYVQALDTYQSAVREGELALVNSIDSKIGAFQNQIQKIQQGQIVRPEVIKSIADAAEQVLSTITSAAQLKSRSFKSQADVAGVGEQWDKYVAGFQTSYQTSNQQTGGQPVYRKNPDGTRTQIK